MVGYKGKVMLGQTTVLNIASWTGGGVTRAMLDSGYLGMPYDVFTVGPKSSDPISITGWYDPTDSTGQEAIRGYLLAGTSITNLRLYFDTNDTDFFTLGQDSEALVESVSSTTAEKGATTLCPISFSLRISKGALVKCTAFYETDTIAFVEGGATDTITDSADGFADAGFVAAMGLIIEGSDSNDQRSLTIANVADDVLTLTATTDDLVSEIAGDTISLIGYTKLSYTV